MRLKRGTFDDYETAIDLGKLSLLIDRVGEVFEEENLTRDEALWAAVLFYLSIYNSTDDFANTALLGSAARALIRDALDVFEELPDPYDDGDEDGSEGVGGAEADAEPEEADEEDDPEDEAPEDDEDLEDDDEEDDDEVGSGILRVPHVG